MDPLCLDGNCLKGGARYSYAVSRAQTGDCPPLCRKKHSLHFNLILYWQLQLYNSSGSNLHLIPNSSVMIAVFCCCLELNFPEQSHCGHLSLFSVQKKKSKIVLPVLSGLSPTYTQQEKKHNIRNRSEIVRICIFLSIQAS